MEFMKCVEVRASVGGTVASGGLCMLVCLHAVHVCRQIVAVKHL